MRRIPLRIVIVAMLLSGMAAGCGGRGEKGKNQDFDRPKPTERK